MNHSGVPEPIYVAARRTLLDALEALQEHRNAVVVVGAQAIYLHTGDADLSVAPYTTDADLAIDPGQLAADPTIERLLSTADFTPPTMHVGAWTKEVDVAGTTRKMVVDLLVPATLGGEGRRAARIRPHGDRTARKVDGLEGVLIDKDNKDIASMEGGDGRIYRVAVAGPGALLVAKLHKIGERAGVENRQRDKDALDLFRLLRGVDMTDLVRRVRTVQSNAKSADAAAQALIYANELFKTPAGPGSLMAARAASPQMSADEVRVSVSALMNELLSAID